MLMYKCIVPDVPPRPTERVEGDPLGEAEGPGQVRAHSGAVLALQVAGHREVVVLSNLEIL